MYHGYKTMSKVIGDEDVIDDIIKSKSRSTFWTAVTLLIFKLEHWTTLKMWRIGLAIWMLCWFKIFSIITVVVIMLRVIIILEILASTQSPIAFSLLVTLPFPPLAAAYSHNCQQLWIQSQYTWGNIWCRILICHMHNAVVIPSEKSYQFPRVKFIYNCWNLPQHHR